MKATPHQLCLRQFLAGQYTRSPASLSSGEARGGRNWKWWRKTREQEGIHTPGHGTHVRGALAHGWLRLRLAWQRWRRSGSGGTPVVGGGTQRQAHGVAHAHSHHARFRLGAAAGDFLLPTVGEQLLHLANVALLLGAAVPPGGSEWSCVTAAVAPWRAARVDTTRSASPRTSPREGEAARIDRWWEGSERRATFTCEPFLQS
jgi:hypothetical protein